MPEKEQPYKLPEGWKWVKLDGLADIIMGQSPRGLDTTDDSSYTPLIGGAADMGAKKLAPHKYTKVVTKLSKKMIWSCVSVQHWGDLLCPMVSTV